MVYGAPAAAEDDSLRAAGDAAKALQEGIRTMAAFESKLGFSQAAPLSGATLGGPMSLVLLDMQKREKQPAATLQDLEIPTRGYVFPVLSGGSVRCLLFMDYDKQSDSWKQSMFGRPNMAKLLKPVMAKWPSSAIKLLLPADTSEFLFSITTEAGPNLTRLTSVDPTGGHEIILAPLASTLDSFRVSATSSGPGGR